jgi:peptide/nickel transport system ATP-binding protein
MVKLLDPTSGTLKYGGRELRALSRQDLAVYRREVQMLFQDPFLSLNPRRTVSRRSPSRCGSITLRIR